MANFVMRRDYNPIGSNFNFDIPTINLDLVMYFAAIDKKKPGTGWSADHNKNAQTLPAIRFYLVNGTTVDWDYSDVSYRYRQLCVLNGIH